MSIKFNPEQSPLYVPRVAPEFTHTASQAGYKRSAAGCRIDHFRSFEVEPMMLGLG